MMTIPVLVDPTPLCLRKGKPRGCEHTKTKIVPGSNLTTGKCTACGKKMVAKWEAVDD